MTVRLPRWFRCLRRVRRGWAVFEVLGVLFLGLAVSAAIGQLAWWVYGGIQRDRFLAELDVVLSTAQAQYRFDAGYVGVSNRTVCSALPLAIRERWCVHVDEFTCDHVPGWGSLVDWGAVSERRGSRCHITWGQRIVGRDDVDVAAEVSSIRLVADYRAYGGEHRTGAGHAFSWYLCAGDRRIAPVADLDASADMPVAGPCPDGRPLPADAAAAAGWADHVERGSPEWLRGYGWAEWASTESGGAPRIGRTASHPSFHTLRLVLAAVPEDYCAALVGRGLLATWRGLATGVGHGAAFLQDRHGARDDVRLLAGVGEWRHNQLQDPEYPDHDWLGGAQDSGSPVHLGGLAEAGLALQTASRGVVAPVLHALLDRSGVDPADLVLANLGVMFARLSANRRGLAVQHDYGGFGHLGFRPASGASALPCVAAAAGTAVLGLEHELAVVIYLEAPLRSLR